MSFVVWIRNACGGTNLIALDRFRDVLAWLEGFYFADCVVLNPEGKMTASAWLSKGGG